MVTAVIVVFKSEVMSFFPNVLFKILNIRGAFQSII